MYEPPFAASETQLRVVDFLGIRSAPFWQKHLHWPHKPHSAGDSLASGSASSLTTISPVSSSSRNVAPEPSLHYNYHSLFILWHLFNSPQQWFRPLLAPHSNDDRLRFLRFGAMYRSFDNSETVQKRLDFQEWNLLRRLLLYQLWGDTKHCYVFTFCFLTDRHVVVLSISSTVTCGIQYSGHLGNVCLRDERFCEDHAPWQRPCPREHHDPSHVRSLNRHGPDPRKTSFLLIAHCFLFPDLPHLPIVPRCLFRPVLRPCPSLLLRLFPLHVLVLHFGSGFLPVLRLHRPTVMCILQTVHKTSEDDTVSAGLEMGTSSVESAPHFAFSIPVRALDFSDCMGLPCRGL